LLLEFRSRCAVQKKNAVFKNAADLVFCRHDLRCWV
jgi:hypothetical protein